eukprot:scaffold90_cov264-Pinguiococcus_pyrenoidosus.AAC.5
MRETPAEEYVCMSQMRRSGNGSLRDYRLTGACILALRQEMVRWINALRDVGKDVDEPMSQARVTVGADGVFVVTGARAMPASEPAFRTASANNMYATLAFFPYAIPSDQFQTKGRIGLLDTVRQRMAHALQSAMHGSPAILVVDEPATKVLSSVCTVSDLVDMGILTVEPLEKPREPLANIDVIYFVDPDFVANASAYARRGGLRRGAPFALSSLERVAADFDDPRRDAPRYTKCKVTVFLLSKPERPSEASVTLQSAPTLWRSMQRRTPCYLSSDLQIVQSRVFSLNDASILARVLTNSVDECMQALATKIAEACYAMNEYPYIRYKLSSSAGGRLSNMVQDELDALLRSSDSFHFHGEEDIANRSTLLILLRSDDLASPLLHDFNFQALVRDVLEDEIDAQQDCINYSVSVGAKGRTETVQRSFYLDSRDPLWKRHRHDHIEDVIGEAYALVQRAKEGDAAQLGKDAELDAISSGIASLSEEVNLRQKAGQLQRICQLAMQQVTQRRLLNDEAAQSEGLAELEQQLLGGLNADGRDVHPRRLLDALLQALETATDQGDRYRLVALDAVCCEHFGDADAKERILEAAALDTVQEQTCEGLHKARALAKELEAALYTGNFWAEQKKAAAKRAKGAVDKKSVREELQRSKSVAFQVAEAVISGDLGEDMFPFTRTPPPGAKLSDQLSAKGGGARSARDSVRSRMRTRRASAKGILSNETGVARRDSASLKTEFTTNRLIIFVAGGVSYAEMQQLHELGLQHNLDVVLGSTDVLTPLQYLRQVEQAGLNNYF